MYCFSDAGSLESLLLVISSIGICDSFCALIYCDRKTTIQERQKSASDFFVFFDSAENKTILGIIAAIDLLLRLGES